MLRFRYIVGRFLVVACVAMSTLGTGIVAPSTSVAAGSIIRGDSFPSVFYLGADGLRYVFPNEKTYFTWYSGFGNVQNIGDEALGKIQIGNNVTYKPGTRLVKINTDPKTYAVEETGVLRWIETEDIAAALYGGDWNKKVDDIPDAFFANYTIGQPIDNAADYVLSDVLAKTTDIGDDKNIVTPAVISITGTAYSPIAVTIATGTSVKFVNNDTVQHTVTADDLTWGSGTLAPGAEFVHTFSSVGIYPFFDSYNSRLTGAIYVENNF